MAETEAKKLSVESWLKVGLMASLVLSVALIGLVSLNKQTVLSPYATADDEYSNQQLTSMRDDFASADFSIANTMSTPMLVNDWQDPHRTMLVIAGPEKPFDAAEASAVYDFVTKKGGKVILAANSTNAQLVADQFGVKYFGDMVLDDQRYYEMTDELDEVLPGDYRRLWAAASLRANVTEMGDERLIP